MKLLKFDPPEVVKRDLLVLANYLESLPDDYEHFDMGTYLAVSATHKTWSEDTFDAHISCHSYINDKWYKDVSSYSEFVLLDKFLSCDTVACVVGHAKFLTFKGIDPVTADWGDLRKYLSDNKDYVDKWIFDSDWQKVDNTPSGAAKRIRYALEFGVPSELTERVTVNVLKEAFNSTKYQEKFTQVEKLDIADRLVFIGAKLNAESNTEHSQ